MSNTDDFAESTEVGESAGSESGVDSCCLGNLVVDLNDIKTIGVSGSSDTESVVGESS